METLDRLAGSNETESKTRSQYHWRRWRQWWDALVIYVGEGLVASSARRL